ncbi:MAG: hypothetical protein MK179_08830 [Pirellulaceae bacterium]|nr:hypothetical protein [Pirellulaceae bacterium]
MIPQLEQLTTTLTSTRTVWIVLWTGVALLTVSLVVISRTRWGQARPTSKCVVLSVFAHLLLIGYAYKTQLFAVHPSSQNKHSDSIQVTLISDSTPVEYDDDSLQTRSQPQPWDQFTIAELAGPQQNTLDRQPLETITKEIEREPHDTPPVFSVPTTEPPANELENLSTELSDTSLTSPAIVDSSSHELVAVSPMKTRDLTEETPNESTVSTDMLNPLPEISVERDNLETLDLPLEREPTTVEIPQPTNTATDLLQQLPDAPNTNLTADFEQAPVEPDDVGPADRATTAQADGGSINNTTIRTNARPPAKASPLPDETFSDDSSTAENKQNDDSTSPATSGQNPQIRPANGTPLPTIYGLRMNEDRDATVRAGGGSPFTENAVQSALSWLARNQSTNGAWDASLFGSGRETRVLGHDRGGAGMDADTGITGLAVLAFLGAGQTHFMGEHRESVQNGLEYILGTNSNGDLGGNARTYARMYCHSIALFAVCEAFALTGDERILPYAQRAVSYSVNAQNSQDGGWRYRPGDRGDMSQFGWQVLALKSAELAGLDVPEVTTGRMRAFLDRCSSGDSRGLAAYRPGEFPSRTMTAEAMLCRLFLYPDPDQAALQEAMSHLSEQLPGQGRANLYYWYYATLALHQLGGETWDRWNTALQETLLNSQRQQGNLTGSWDADTAWGSYGGRVYSTAMATLCLESYYRYRLPPPSRQARRVNE